MIDELCNRCKRGKYQGECRHCKICYCGRKNGNEVVTCHHHLLEKAMSPEQLKKWEPPLSPEALAIQGRKRLGRKR